MSALISRSRFLEELHGFQIYCRQYNIFSWNGPKFPEFLIIVRGCSLTGTTVMHELALVGMPMPALHVSLPVSPDLEGTDQPPGNEVDFSPDV